MADIGIRWAVASVAAAAIVAGGFALAPALAEPAVSPAPQETVMQEEGASGGESDCAHVLATASAGTTICYADPEVPPGVPTPTIPLGGTARDTP